MKNINILFIALVLFLSIVTLSAKNPNVSGLKVNTFWTNNPPGIDGKMDDECWKSVTPVRNFKLQMCEGKLASRKTEAYICYDAANLYLFWKCYQPAKKKYVRGPAPDYKDVISEKESIQVFIDPNHERKNYYKFIVNPSGATLDFSLKKRLKYNPVWTCATGTFPEGWTVEMAIPFKELMQDGEYRGTPQRDDGWGVNLCRTESVVGEKSQYSLTGRNFGNYGCYGTLRFMGCKTGEQFSRVILKNYKPLFFGKNKLRLELRNSKAITGQYTVKCNSKTESCRQQDIKSGCPLKISIFRGGNWSVTGFLQENGKVFYCLYIRKQLPELRKVINEISIAVKSGNKRLVKFRHPETKNLKENVSRIKSGLDKISANLNDYKKLTREEWKILESQVQELEKQWQKLAFDINLINLYPDSKKIRDFALGTAFPEKKIYRDTVYRGSTTGPVKLAVAGNETDSFQLLVIPFWKSLKDVKVKFSDLKGENGIIKADNFRWFKVGYVRLMDNHPLVTNKHKYEPDILFPGKPFDVKLGTVQSIWIDIYAPPGTPAGKYQGEVTVSADGREASRKLDVTVFGFDIPKKISLKQNHWFGWNGSRNWAAFYRYKVKYTPELFEKHINTMSRYRVQPFFFNGEVLYRQIPIWLEKDGTLSFDFSTFDKYIEIGKKYNANAFWAGLSCNFWSGLRPFVTPKWRIRDRRTGSWTTMGKLIKKWREKTDKHDPDFSDNPAHHMWIKAYIKHLKKLGMLGKSYFEYYDEPYSSETRWLGMLRHHALLKKLAPEIKLQAYGVNPLQKFNGTSAKGKIDVWSIHLKECANPEMLKAIYDRRKKYGEEFWFYACSEKQAPDGEWSPFIKYNRPYAGARIIPWMAWKYQADGFLVYKLNHSYKVNNMKKPDKRWPHTDWQAGRMNGSGTLLYPGPEPECEAIPSIRLANLRDGMEDYEYFHVLRERLKQLDRIKYPELAGNAEKLLQIPDRMIPDPYHWPKDTAKLDNIKYKLGLMIEKISKLEK